ncbi:MAG TPA: 1,4-dihydroxy-2-naphthoate octaprenyltransferase, partial [Magnetospirillum sp.]|nr:1,4-dihydroxy-2-naphthoate octaprenyltransferase [Magnetospirillum sp.]
MRGDPERTGENGECAAFAPPPTGFRLWLAAIRPRTLTIALAPVMAGAGWVWGQAHTLRLLPLVATLLGALLI